MRKLEMFCLFIFIPFFMLAQDQKVGEFIVKGIVVNEHNKPVPFAGIGLYSRKDTSYILTVTSDVNGKFSMLIPPGSWILKISSVSYKKKQVVVDITNAELNLGNISLNANSTTLGEVIVSSEKKLMELKLDKRIYNVSQDVTNIGSNASDILANIPSVEVDIEGNVSLRGSQGVRILIDGKPSALTGIRSNDALKNLQGTMIDRIEVVTNPSSRYDASGESGIINIVLKKIKTRGFNGNFTVTAGHPSNYNASYSINYRTQKVNIFSSLGSGYRNSPGHGFSTQRYTGADTSFFYDQFQERRRKRFSGNFLAGIEYYSTPNTTITGSVLFNRGRGKNTSEFLYDDYSNSGILNQTTFRTDNEKEREKNTEVSLSYRKKFPEKVDKEWTTDFKWTNSGETENSEYLQGIKGSSEQNIQRSGNPAYEDNILLQTDYVLPFNDNARFEAGFKGTIRTITNNYLVEEFRNGNWSTLPAFDNNVEFNEKIIAGYALLGNKFSKYSYQLGLRGEMTYMKTGLVKTNEINKRSYFNLFPSTSFSYNLNDKNTFQVSYSYRINRPNFRNLTPFADFSDPRVFFVGNPNLNPEFTHSLEISHLLDWHKGSLLSGVFYRHKKGVVERVRLLDTASGVTNIFPVNLSVQDDLGIETALFIEIKNWWKFNTSFNLYSFNAKGKYGELDFASKGLGWTSRATSKIAFLKDMDFQVSAFYRSPRNNTQGKTLGMYSIDLGLAKDMFGGKGTLTFNVQDIMNSRKRRSIVDLADYYSESEFQWRPRQFRLSLNFRINQQKIEKKQEDSQDDEGFENG